jgi:chemotaxis protein MotA
MDIGTIIGLISGTVLMVGAIAMGGSLLMFLDIPSILIVGGGTLATVLIKFKLADVINSVKVAMKAFLVKIENPEDIIEEMVAYTRTAKKEGLIALEKEKPNNQFTAKALRYLSDGYEEAMLEEILTKDIRLTIQRHTTGQGVFKALGDVAPAWGMIGTLIGLVQMLSSMDDPASIGPAMAVALLTTLYGAVIANFVCLPIADKLMVRSEQESFNKSIVVEAAIAINRGISPMILEDSLRIYLSPRQRNGKENGNTPAENAKEAEAK